MIDPKQRFSDRVENYVRFRPGYPAEVLRILERSTGLTANSIVADIGSGTGISTKLFLDYGNTVYAVEPNLEMRHAAEQLLAGNVRFRSVEGTAEATTVADRSVDFVVAGQAFHWFNRPAARSEFVRILRPSGWVVLLWNDRRTEGTQFLIEYEALLHEFATDYRQVDHKLIDEPVIQKFFAPAVAQLHSVENAQLVDLEGLIGRVNSSSYMPTADHPRYSEMVQAFTRLFEKHQQQGRVKIEYNTIVYCGQLTAE